MSYTIPPAVVNQRVKELTKLWGTMFPLDAPSDAVFKTWLSSHSFLTVAFGLTEAAKKFCRMQGRMSQEEVIRYSSKITNSRTKVLKILKQQQKEKLCQRN
jgi:hypothetical protein